MRFQISRKTALMTIAFLLSGMICAANPASAAAEENTEMTTVNQKITFTNLYKCYWMKDGVKQTIKAEDYNGAAIFNKNSKIYQPKLPNYKKSGGAATCKTTLQDAATYATKTFGVTEPSKIPPSASNSTDVATFMEHMGYKGTGKKYCSTFQFEATTSDKYKGKPYVKICGKVDDSGTIKGKITAQYSGASAEKVATIVSKKIAGDSKKYKLVITPSGGIYENGNRVADTAKHNYTVGSTKWETIRKKVLKDLSSANLTITYKNEAIGLSVTDKGDSGNAYSSYTVNGTKKDAGNSAVQYLSANTYNKGNLALSPSNKVALLNAYLNKYYKIKNHGCDLKGDAKTIAEGKGAKETRIYVDGTFQMCYIEAKANHNKEVVGWSEGNVWAPSSKLNFQKICDLLTKGELANVNSLAGGANALNDGSDVNAGETVDSEATSACFQYSGALGWIMCPVLKTVGDAAAALYESTADNFLEINASFLAQNEDNGTYFGWQQFQGYANIIFAILLIFVIVSQLTGFGISNYGIKKTLPRLVLGVVLINLSFIICQLAVDLSNILGHELYEFFTQDIVAKATDSENSSFGSMVGTIVQYLVGGAEIGVAGLAVGKLALATVPWDQWLLPLIIGIIVCVIGVIFYFVLLAIRKAGVIILVILAPAAIVCYALPNTKKIFDRWYKLFTSLLLVYPICGLVMGGSQFMGKMILTSMSDGNVKSGGEFTMVLSAMLLMVVPFFFIPAILKASFSAMGAIGNRIATFGDRFSRGFARAAKGSEIYRNAQREVAKANAGYMSKRLKSKYGGDIKNIKSLGARRRYAGIFAANKKVLQDEAEAANATFMQRGDENYNKMVAGIEDEKMSRDVRNDRSYISLHGNDIGIDPKNIDSLGGAFNQALDNLSDNPTDYDAQVRVRSLADTLAQKGDVGRKQIERAFQRSARTGSYKNEGTRSFLNYTMDQYAKDFEDGNRSLYSLANDMLNDNVTNDFTEALDKSGNGTGQYYSQHYIKKGVEGLSAQGYRDSDDSIYENAKLYMQQNSDDNEFRQQITSLSDEIYSNPQLSGGAKGSSEQARQLALLQSTDAKSLGQLSGQTVDRTTRAIKNGTLEKSDAINAAQQAYNSLNDKTISHTDDNYAALRNLIQTTNAMGHTQFTLPPERRSVNGDESIKIVHGDNASFEDAKRAAQNNGRGQADADYSRRQSNNRKLDGEWWK